MRTLVTSLLLALAGDAVVMLVSHGESVLEADLSWYHWLQAALSLAVLFGLSVYILGRRAPAETSSSRRARPSDQ